MIKKIIYFRFADEKDIKDIYRWRNNPVTVKFSPTGKVEYKEHVKWFSQKLKDSNTNLLIIINQDMDKIGIVRFDQQRDKAEISINLNPDYRSQGYGKICLIKALNLYFSNFEVNEVTARIHPKNTVSQKLFFKIGFNHDYKMVDGFIFTSFKKRSPQQVREFSL